MFTTVSAECCRGEKLNLVSLLYLLRHQAVDVTEARKHLLYTNRIAVLLALLGIQRDALSDFAICSIKC